MSLLSKLGLKSPPSRAGGDKSSDESSSGDDPDPAAGPRQEASPDASGQPGADPLDAELGAALGALEATLGTITDDALAAPARVELQTLQTGRAKAMDETNPSRRAAALRALIAAAKRAQGKAALPAQQSQATDRRESVRKEVEVTLGQVTPIVLSGMLDDGLGKAVDKELAALKLRFDTADRLKDTAAAEKALAALVEPARALLARAQAAKEVSDWVTFKLQPLMSSARRAVDAIVPAGAKAALKAQLDGLEADRQRYVAAIDLAAIQTIVFPVLEPLDKAARRIVADAPVIDKSLADLGRGVAELGAAATPALKLHLTALLERRKAWPEGANVGLINVSLTGFALELEALHAEFDAVHESQPGPRADKRLKALRKTLELYNETAYSFSDHDDRAEATKKGWDFSKRLDDAQALADIPARMRLFDAIDPDLHAALRDLKKVQFKDRLKEKGGRAELDNLIGKMGNATTNPDDLATCEAAIEACFGVEVKLSSDPAKVKTLPRLYKMLSKVPEWQTHQSEFKKIDFETIPANTTSFYYPGRARISLDATGDGTNKTRNKIPEYDPAAKEVKADYFNFTTLHEVGHSVDDKIDFMDNNGKDPAYGGWRSESIDSIVKHFGENGGFYARHEKGKATRDDLKKLLQSVLTTQAATKPDGPKKSLGSLIDQWDAIMKDPIVVICTNGVLEANAVWDGGAAKAAAIVVDGRVCHQSQANDWYSYQHSARKASGVSHYQWRAPAEWFAEIYAMYYMDELKPSHPMYAWFGNAAKSEKSAKKKPGKGAGTK